MQRVRVGDLVQVISGKDKGRTGKVLKLLKDEERVVVEGIAMVTRHTKPNARNQEGGKIEKEASIHVSKVMPVDPNTGKGTRVRAGKDEAGKPVRMAVKSGAVVPTPAAPKAGA